MPDPTEKSDFQPVQKDIKEEPSTSKQEASTSSAQTPKPSSSPDEQHGVSKPPPHFINYYLQVARVIIGFSEEHLRVYILFSHYLLYGIVVLLKINSFFLTSLI